MGGGLERPRDSASKFMNGNVPPELACSQTVIIRQMQLCESLRDADIHT